MNSPLQPHRYPENICLGPEVSHLVLNATRRPNQALQQTAGADSLLEGQCSSGPRRC
jgi:hypothetical protein